MFNSQICQKSVLALRCVLLPDKKIKDHLLGDVMCCRLQDGLPADSCQKQKIQYEK